MRNRPRQIARVSLGLCPDCGEDDAAPGGLRCARCREEKNERHRNHYRAQREAGIPRYDAARLRELADEAMRVRAKLIDRRVCIQCRGPVQKFRRCNKCRSMAAEQKRAYRLRIAQANLPAEQEQVAVVASTISRKRGGRPESEDAAYARAIGVRPNLVTKLGGAEKLRSLSPEARNVLLKYYRSPPGLCKGGIAARGMGQRKEVSYVG